MRAKRPHVLITESNKSEQPDSNHDKLFIDVSKQSDELFQYQGNTSSDDQYKNQQLDTETVSQQGLYNMPSADVEQTFHAEMPPVIPTSTTISQRNLYNMPQQYSFNNAFQPVFTASKYGTTSNIKFQYAAAAWRTKTNLSSYLLPSNHGRFQCVCDICCSSKFQCRQPLFYEQRNTFFYDLQT